MGSRRRASRRGVLLPLRAGIRPAVAAMMFRLLAAMAFPAMLWAHPGLHEMLARMDQDIRSRPGDYPQRAERAWLMLQHGDAGGPVAGDIDTLLSHPASRP